MKLGYHTSLRCYDVNFVLFYIIYQYNNLDNTALEEL